MVSDPIAGRAAGTRIPPTFEVIHALVVQVVKAGMQTFTNGGSMPAFMLEAPVVHDRIRAAKSYDGCEGQDVPLEQVDLMMAAQALIADAALVAFPEKKQGYIMVGKLHGLLSLTGRADRIARARDKRSGKHWLDSHRRGDVEQIAQALFRALYYADDFAAELVVAREIAGLTHASNNN